MNKKNILLFLCLPLLLLVGCTKEDYRNCPAGLYVTFDAQNPKHNYTELVQRLDLYFYGQDGNLAADFHYEREDLRSYDRAAFVSQLQSGDYRLVAIVNDGFDTQTSDAGKYSTLRSRLKKESVDNKTAEFFAAEKQITIGIPNSSEVPTEKLQLSKHNNDVRLKVVYDGYVAPANTTIQAYMRGNNGAYEYASKNSPAACLTTYLPWDVQTTVDGALPAQFDMTTMYIRHGGDICLHLEERGNTRSDLRSVTLNLTEELKKVKDSSGQYLYDTDEKLWYHDQYEITITLGKDFVVLGLVIDNWNIIGGGVEV